jgi:hypothetical protein
MLFSGVASETDKMAETMILLRYIIHSADGESRAEVAIVETE